MILLFHAKIPLTGSLHYDNSVIKSEDIKFSFHNMLAATPSTSMHSKKEKIITSTISSKVKKEITLLVQSFQQLQHKDDRYFW